MFGLNNLFKRKQRFQIGEKCNFKDIEVGEVFGMSGCFNILFKDSKHSAILLSKDYFSIPEVFLGKKLKLAHTFIGKLECLKITSGPLIKDPIPELNKLPRLILELDVEGAYKLPKETQELFIPTEDNF